MYKKFNLSSVKPDAIHKQIILKFNYDIDEDSIQGNFFNIVSVSGDHISFKYSIHDNIVVLKLEEWPEPNTEYQILIEKNIKNIAGQELSNGIRYKLKFESEITSVVTIKKPYNFEKLQDLNFIFSDTEKVNNYYIEIATENTFYNYIYSGEISTNEVSPVIPDIKPGQYYIRARVQKNNEFGKWSKPVTFIYKNVCECEENKEDGPSADTATESAWQDLFGDGSVYEPTKHAVIEHDVIEEIKPDIIDELEIITYPEQGVTPDAFTFELNKELDSDLGEVILIKREF